MPILGCWTLIVTGSVFGEQVSRGPLGLFAQPRHTFAQYDDDGEGDAEGMNTDGDGAKTAREDRQKTD